MTIYLYYGIILIMKEFTIGDMVVLLADEMGINVVPNGQCRTSQAHYTVKGINRDEVGLKLCTEADAKRFSMSARSPHSVTLRNASRVRRGANPSPVQGFRGTK